MSKRQSIRRKKTSLAATTAAATLAAVAQLAPVAPMARAASVTWTGGGADDNWSTGANWTPSGYTNGDSITFDGTTRLTPNNNTTADNQVSGITFNAGAGAFTLGGNRITLVGSMTDASLNAQTINLDMVLSGNQNINPLYTASSLVFNGVISDGGSFSGINKGGGGTTTLNAVNTFKGNTTVTGGTLVLNGNSGAGASIDSNSQLVLGGNGNFSYIGNAAGSTQTFNNMSLNAGRGQVSVTSNGNPANLVLNSIGRNTGGIINFVTPASGNITTTSTHQNGTILGGWATVNGTTWAVTGTGGGGPFNVTGLATYQTDFNTSTNDVDVPTGTTTLSAATSVNSMRFNSAGTTTTTFAGTGALTLNSGGILMTSNVTTAPTWSHTGTLTSSSGELNVISTSASQTLTIASQVAGNITLNIAAGTSTVTFTNNNNSFTGDVNIISGRFGTTNNNGLMGTTSNLVRVFGNEGGGGQYFQGNVSLPSSRNFQISGYGYAESGGGSSFGAIRMRNTIAGIITLAGNTRVGNNGNNAGTFSGKITGAYEFAIMNENGVHQNALIISGTTNDYSGGTRIERGKLAMGAVNALPQDTLLTFGTAFSNATTEAMRVRGSTPPTLDLNSRNTSISGATVQASDTGYTANGGTATIMNSSGTAATLTVGASGASSSFSGVLTANMGLTKTGGGTFTLTHTNFQAGDTNISQGTLAASGANAAAVTGATGTYTTSSNVITATGSGLLVGQRVSATGIPANTYIVNINGTSVTLSQTPTAAGTNAALTIPGGNAVSGGNVINLSSGATLNVSGVSGGFALLGTQTLTNNGTVNGNVTAPTGSNLLGTGTYSNTLTLSGTSNTSGGMLSPGNSVGNVNVNTLTASGGGVLNLEFSPDGGSIDTITVTGTATLAGAGINLSLLALAPTQTSYTILTAGTLASNPVLNTTTIGRNTFTLNTSTANTLKIDVAGAPASLRWDNSIGGGNGTTWDATTAATSKNWVNGAAGDWFFQNDSVTFNDTNNGKYAVTVSGAVNPGGMTVDTTNNYTFSGSGSIDGVALLTKSGAGSLTINTTGNTYSGGTTLSAGTLKIGGTTTTMASLGTGTLTIGAGTTIDNTSGAAATLANNVPQVWNGSFTFTGSQSLNLGTGAVTLNATPTITVSNNTLTVGGAVSGGFGITKAGTGTLTLNGASSYSGGVTISDGVVRLGNVTAAGGGGTINVNAGTTLVSSIGANGTIANPLTLNGSTLGSAAADTSFSGVINVNGNNTVYTVDPQNPGGTTRNVYFAGLVHGGGNISVIQSTATTNPDGAQGLRFVGDAASDYSGTVTYNNNTKAELLSANTGTNTPAGTARFLISAGAAALNDTTNATTGTVQVAGYTEFNLRNNSGGDVTFGNDVEINGSGIAVINGLGSAPVGAVANMGNLRIGAGQELVLYLSNGNNAHVTAFNTVTLTGNTTFSPRHPHFGATNQVGGDLALGTITETASSSITMNGLRTLFLNGNNNFTGGLTINSGTVQLGNAGALNSTTPQSVAFAPNANTTSAILRANGISVTVSSLQTNATSNSVGIENANATPATLTVNNASANTYAGYMQDGTGGGALSLTKSGTGLLVLAGASANTYTGTTTVNDGTLQIGNGGTAGSLGTGPVVVNSASSLNFNRSDTLTYGGSISGTGTVNQNGTGTLVLTGASTHSVTNVNNGTLVVNGSLASGGSVAVNSGGHLGGSGSVGNLTLNGGSFVHPGSSAADGVVGTLNANSLTATAGELDMDLTAPGTNDKINVTGAATVSNGLTIVPGVVGSPVAGSYTLITADTLSHATNPVVSFGGGGGGSRVTAAISYQNNNASPGDDTLVLTLSGSGANKTWTGAISGNWSVGGSNPGNWTDSGTGDTLFLNLDGVTFDASSGVHNVTLTQNVAPSAMTVNIPGDTYTINTNGFAITGDAGLTITNGTLVLKNTGAGVNSFGGAISIGANTLELQTGGTIGDGAITSSGGNLKVNRTGTVTVGQTITGAVNLSVDGGATVNVNGANSIPSGNLTVANGTLKAGTATALPAVTNNITFGSAGNTFGTLDVGGNNLNSVKNLNSIGTSTANVISNNSATTDATINFIGDTTASVYNGSINSGSGGKTLSVSLTGGSVTVGGSANTYSGATTVIGGATLNFAGNVGSGALTIGKRDTAGANTGSVGNLSIGDNSTVSTMTVPSNTGTADVITIASGKTLNVSGRVELGTPPVGGQGGVSTVATFTGGGILNVTTSTNTGFYVGLSNMPNTGSVSGDRNLARVDMTGLTNFTYSTGAAGTGTFGVGWGSRPDAQLRLASGTNLIQANSIRVGDSSITPGLPNIGTGDNSGGTSVLFLGAGVNNLYTPSLIVGQTKGSGTINWQDPANGSVTIRGQDGVARANITVGNFSSGSATGSNSRILLAGHTANVMAGTVIIGRLAATGSGLNNEITFDTGTFDVDNLQIGVNTGANTAGTPPAADGIFTLGNTSNTSTGVLTVNTQFALGLDSNTASSPTHARFNVLGGTANINTDIVVTTNDSDAGNIFAVTVDGGTLNMMNHAIGTAATPAVALTAASGTIKNVTQINAGSTGLTKTGTKTLTLDGVNTFTGATTVSAGTLQYATSYTTGSSLTVTDGATAFLKPNGTNNLVVKTPTVATSGSGRVDIGDNKLIVTTPNSVGSATAGVYNGISGLIQSGRNGGGWGGPGIVTSQSSATGGNFTSIGIATAAQVKGIAATATAVFAGQTVSGSDTLVMYTYGGDANLDGKVNVDDYGKIDFNIAIGSTGWANGDFNYDGKINVDDYGIIDFNIGIQGPQFATGAGASGGLSASAASALSGVSAVPEPAGLGVVALGAMSLLGRRRRRDC